MDPRKVLYLIIIDDYSNLSKWQQYGYSRIMISLTLNFLYPAQYSAKSTGTIIILFVVFQGNHLHTHGMHPKAWANQIYIFFKYMQYSFWYFHLFKQ